MEIITLKITTGSTTSMTSLKSSVPLAFDATGTSLISFNSITRQMQTCQPSRFMGVSPMRGVDLIL